MVSQRGASVSVTVRRSAGRNVSPASQSSLAMFKAFRLAKEKTLDKPVGQDAEDKKKIKDLEDCLNELEKTLEKAYRSFAEYNGSMLALHVDLANLYPAKESLSLSIMALNNPGSSFHNGPKIVRSAADDFPPYPLWLSSL